MGIRHTGVKKPQKSKRKKKEKKKKGAELNTLYASVVPVLQKTTFDRAVSQSLRKMSSQPTHRHEGSDRGPEARGVAAPASSKFHAASSLRGGKGEGSEGAASRRVRSFEFQKPRAGRSAKGATLHTRTKNPHIDETMQFHPWRRNKRSARPRYMSSGPPRKSTRTCGRFACARPTMWSEKGVCGAVRGLSGPYVQYMQYCTLLVIDRRHPPLPAHRTDFPTLCGPTPKEAPPSFFPIASLPPLPRLPRPLAAVGAKTATPTRREAVPEIPPWDPNLGAAATTHPQ